MDCLARLFDAVNAMDLSSVPTLSRNEKLILRLSERRDTFVEKFSLPRRSSHDVSSENLPNRSQNGGIDDGVSSEGSTAGQGRAQTPNSVGSDISSALGGSVVWVGEQDLHSEIAKESARRTSFDRASVASGASTNPKEHLAVNGGTHSSSSDGHGHHAQPSNLDTHFYSTTIAYKGYVLPIKIPLYLFPGEVGDVSGLTSDFFPQILIRFLLSTPLLSLSKRFRHRRLSSPGHYIRTFIPMAT